MRERLTLPEPARPPAGRTYLPQPRWRPGKPDRPGLWIVRMNEHDYVTASVELSQDEEDGHRYLRCCVDGFSEPLDDPDGELSRFATLSYGPIPDPKAELYLPARDEKLIAALVYCRLRGKKAAARRPPNGPINLYFDGLSEPPPGSLSTDDLTLDDLDRYLEANPWCPDPRSPATTSSPAPSA